VAHLNKNGILILCGILQKYEKNILEEYSNLKLIQKLEENEWRALVYEQE